MRANSVFRVLAGGSLRWASCAASTAPLPASATTQDRAETSGTSGAPDLGRTCVPERYSRDARGAEDRGPLGAPGSVPAGTAAATGPSTSTPVTHNAQADTADRELKEDDPIFIQET